MSRHEWGIIGYGVCTDVIDTTVERVETLLSHAPQFQKDVRDYFAECEIKEPTLDDYLDYDQDYMTGIAYLIGKVVEEAEGVRLNWEVDGYDNYYLLLPATYPWLMNQREKNLTEEQCRMIFAKYIGILTDQEIEVEYVNTTMFG